MLEQLSDLGRYRVATIDLANVYGHLVIASPHVNDNGYSQLKMEKLFSFDDNDQLKQTLAKEKASLISYIATGAETLVETCPVISANNLGNQKRIHGVSEKEHVSDYFNFPDGAILCALPIGVSKSTSSVLSELSRSSSLINQSEIAVTNLYNKLYDGENSHTAIVNFTSEHIALTIIDKQTPICTGSLKIGSGSVDASVTTNNTNSDATNTNTNTNTTNTSNDRISLAATLFQEVRSISQRHEATATTSSEYNLVLLVGECDQTDLDNLRKALAAANITVHSMEMFNPLIYGFINIESLPTREQKLLELEGHRYVVAIAGAVMALEYSGVDLSVDQEELVKTYSKQVSFYTPQSYLVKSVDVAMQVGSKVRRAVATRSSLLVLAFILSLGLIGYNYYQITNQLASTEKQISEAKSKLEALKDVKAQYQQYQTKVKVKNDRIKTIQDIQLSQLIVPTILTQLQGAQRPLEGLMKFNSIEIASRNINVSGEAIDKAQTITFLKNLSDTGAFIDVNPVYDSTDSVKCRYSLTTNYIGPVRGNPIVLPVSNTQIQFNENPTTNRSDSNLASKNNPNLNTATNSIK